MANAWGMMKVDQKKNCEKTGGLFFCTTLQVTVIGLVLIRNLAIDINHKTQSSGLTNWRAEEHNYYSNPAVNLPLN